MKKSHREAGIIRSILEDLRSRGRAVWYRKNHGGPFGSSGVPDIEVVFRPIYYIPKDDEDGSTTRITREQAIVVFLEVKRPGEKPTAIQQATMAAIGRAGGVVRVVRSKDEAVGFLESLGLPPSVCGQGPAGRGREWR